MRFVTGAGFALLGWVLCVGAALLMVVLREEHGIELEGFPDTSLTALIWLPGLCYLLVSCLRHGVKGLAPRVAGVLVGLALPLALGLALMLVYGVPHA